MTRPVSGTFRKPRVDQVTTQLRPPPLDLDLRKIQVLRLDNAPAHPRRRATLQSVANREDPQRPSFSSRRPVDSAPRFAAD